MLIPSHHRRYKDTLAVTALSSMASLTLMGAQQMHATAAVQSDYLSSTSSPTNLKCVASTEQQIADIRGDTDQLAVQAAVANNILDPQNNPAVMLIDLKKFNNHALSLQSSFKACANNVLHAFAIKANPLGGVLRHAASLGLGAECASIVEVKHALSCGIPSNRIVFDSPTKTDQEILYCLTLPGIIMNLDSLQEIDRVAVLIKNNTHLDDSTGTRIGLRINPQLGVGAIASTSTATATSKFGVALLDHRDEILDQFKRNTFLTGIHCHVGSQGCSIQMMVDGVKSLIDLVQEINNVCGDKERIQTIDIGGGLPVNYNSAIVVPTFQSYADELRKQVPYLWSFGGMVVTEFGRSLIQKCGVLASYVNATKVSGGRKIATVYVGADLLLRTCYLPEKWKHRFSVLCGKSGQAKCLDGCKTTESVQDVAGPCCFSGDLICRNRLLPNIETGDVVIVHDTGGYSIGMFSRYNSRLCLPVYTYNSSDVGSSFVLIKKKEVWEDVSAFWG